ncbi:MULTISPECIES: helix-turn-helix domain-containing protein [Clostridium]|uniref:Helix-turn-helix domain protein n=1 Tax=Clostridium butyricum E4 str. BoNT E BL5262 TaxID=632245 RepID=C4IHM2_CLOBU|nr:MULTISPECIES: helix-turn-helix transcriptional regulator [Clostridium]APF23480.1 helix-turn-helix family protein [Clostridium butyricum]EDT74745.1 transcriptional regulator, XRE family [Clostridium butyricum 5521]EEP53554.1 helix-turn-helix domain protein [Clostridium butyricum E4 str. BoNT E BL5262]MBN1041464.1 XRE family transcriptional regulator [Clostridium botulinum]NFL30613.1 helix-turn-helix transcriptional regulator [Clostridium butyricum]
MNRNIIGKKVRIIRKAKNLTQEELIARIQLKGLNIDRPMLSRIETDSREVYDFEVKAIAEALDISVDELFIQN